MAIEAFKGLEKQLVSALCRAYTYFESIALDRLGPKAREMSDPTRLFA
jgi:hypothetical protein